MPQHPTKTFALSNNPLPGLARKIGDEIKNAAASRRGFIEATIEIARALATAREVLPDDRSFGRWLDTVSELAALNPHDRAALIKMGQYPDLAAEALKLTERMSWRLIFEIEMRPFLPVVSRRRKPPGKDGLAGLPNRRRTAARYMREVLGEIEELLSTPLAAFYLPLVDPGERVKAARMVLDWLVVEPGWLLMQADEATPPAINQEKEAQSF